MIFRVDATSSTPVYRQIIDQVRYAVATGRLQEGDRLAPIRDVAVKTRVNRNTVARAYAELERSGVLRNRAGQGSFVVMEEPSISRARARKFLSEQIDIMLVEAHQLRFTEPDIMKLLAERLEKIDFGRDKD